MNGAGTGWVFTGELHRLVPRVSPVNFTGFPRVFVIVNTSIGTDEVSERVHKALASRRED